jgi:hypothetical protein
MSTHIRRLRLEAIYETANCTWTAPDGDIPTSTYEHLDQNPDHHIIIMDVKTMWRDQKEA